MKIRQQVTASESYNDAIIKGNLAEMDEKVLMVITKGVNYTAQMIIDVLKWHYKPASITGAINRLRYQYNLIKGRKLEFHNKRTVTYYSVRKENESVDKRPLSRVEFLEAEIELMKTEIKQLKFKNEMLNNNFVLKK